MYNSRGAWHTQYDMLFWNYRYELRRHSYVSIAGMELLAVVLIGVGRGGGGQGGGGGGGGQAPQ